VRAFAFAQFLTHLLQPFVCLFQVLAALSPHPE
jgi:hypothetical protein